MVSPLEMSACIVIVDTSEHEGQNIQTALAVLILLLAVSDWHVPLTVQSHYTICRLLSSMCMQALFPSAIALICWAFAHPTFRKKTHTISESESRASDSGHGTSENLLTPTEDRIVLDEVIAEFEAME